VQIADLLESRREGFRPTLHVSLNDRWASGTARHAGRSLSADSSFAASNLRRARTPQGVSVYRTGSAHQRGVRDTVIGTNLPGARSTGRSAQRQPRLWAQRSRGARGGHHEGRFSYHVIRELACWRLVRGIGTPIPVRPQPRVRGLYRRPSIRRRCLASFSPRLDSSALRDLGGRGNAQSNITFNRLQYRLFRAGAAPGVRIWGRPFAWFSHPQSNFNQLEFVTLNARTLDRHAVPPGQRLSPRVSARPCQNAIPRISRLRFPPNGLLCNRNVTTPGRGRTAASVARHLPGGTVPIGQNDRELHPLRRLGTCKQPRPATSSPLASSRRRRHLDQPMSISNRPRLGVIDPSRVSVLGSVSSIHAENTGFTERRRPPHRPRFITASSPQYIPM